MLLFKLDIASWSQCCFLLARNQLVDSYSLPYKWAKYRLFRQKNKLR